MVRPAVQYFGLSTMSEVNTAAAAPPGQQHLEPDVLQILLLNAPDLLSIRELGRLSICSKCTSKIMVEAGVWKGIFDQAAGPTTKITSSNRYFRDCCISLFHQHLQKLNEDFAEFVQANRGRNPFWKVYECIRQISKWKEMYASDFPGVVFTCGSNVLNTLGYDAIDNVSRPTRVRALPMPIVQISSGAIHTVVRDGDGRVYAFGCSDSRAMGRNDENHTGDLRVTGFHPSKHASFLTPIDNEESCIVKMRCGTQTTLFLTVHGNLYQAGCFRDYEDTQLRMPKPLDDTSVVEENAFPYGFNGKPTHLYQIPGKVVDMDGGTYMNAAILEDGTLWTWGVGIMGELGRPVDDNFVEKATGVYDEELLGKQFLKPCPVHIPAPLSTKMVAVSVACGSGHLVVVARETGSVDSTVYASGFNADGQLGLGDTTNRKMLTPLLYTKDENWMIARVACGSFHTLALDLSKRRLYGCGRCHSGQLGHTDGEMGDDRSTWFVNKLQPVPFPQDNIEIEEIACGEHHNLVIVKPEKGRHEVYTWGFGGYAGALGHGIEGIEEIEWRPRRLDFPMKDGQEMDGDWRGVSGGALHSTFLFSQK